MMRRALVVLILGLLLVALLSVYGATSVTESPSPRLTASPRTIIYGGRERTETGFITYTGPAGSSVRVRGAVITEPGGVDFRIGSESCTGATLRVNDTCFTAIRLIRRGGPGAGVVTVASVEGALSAEIIVDE
jgi:hypothetical protein